MGSWHRQKETQGVEVSAIASRTPEKAEEFGARHGIPRRFGSYEALLECRDIDAVYIALPPALHYEWARRAIEAGKHVLCEKPLAENAQLAQELMSVARRHDLVLAEAMHIRYLERLRRQRELIAGGEFGPLLRIESCFRTPYTPMAKGDFRRRFELGGGAALDVGCYAVSCLRYMAGEEPEVVAVEYKCSSPQIDRWMRATVRFPSGLEGVAEFGFSGFFMPRSGVDVTCEKGWIKWDAKGLKYQKDGNESRESVPTRSTHQLQLEAFAKSIRGEQSNALPPDDAVLTARVIDAIYEKAGARFERYAPHIMKDIPWEVTPQDAEGHLWDVIVIGAGAGGSTAGFNLARLGRSVLFVERGKLLDYDPSVVRGVPFAWTGNSEAALNHGWWPRSLYCRDEEGNVAPTRPPIGSGAGGSTAQFGAVLDRFRPEDFTPRRFFPDMPDATLPEAWPVSYEEMVPFYDRAESLYRVRGTQDPLAATTANLLEPPAASDRELAVFDALKGAGLNPYRIHRALERLPGCSGCAGMLCPHPCRNDAARICLYPALERYGAKILPNCRAIFFEERERVVERVICELSGRRITLRARVFILAANVRSREAPWPASRNGADCMGH